jgi:hypothetical protein
MLKIRCLIGREKLVAYDWLMPAKERMLENFNAQIYAQNEKIVFTESQEDMLLTQFALPFFFFDKSLFYGR